MIEHTTDRDKLEVRYTSPQVVNNQAFEADVRPQDIFHEALEYALPKGLLVGHRIRISTPNGKEVFPDMFIGKSVQHFQTSTFHVEARPLSDNRRVLVSKHGRISVSITWRLR